MVLSVQGLKLARAPGNKHEGYIPVNISRLVTQHDKLIRKHIHVTKPA